MQTDKKKWKDQKCNCFFFFLYLLSVYEETLKRGRDHKQESYPDKDLPSTVGDLSPVQSSQQDAHGNKHPVSNGL